MIPHLQTRFPAWGRAVLLILSVAATGTAANAFRSAAVVRADVTSVSPREQFKAGGERSEVVLREILSVLQKMDSRLERIERAATESARTSQTSSRNGNGELLPGHTGRLTPGRSPALRNAKEAGTP